ncbi:hypothetical protein [Luteibacter sp. CQ10]|uniref:hypothetical protein n=1 Tax=Luteibacter sp. CQ10 TaxID=2805821 RepID=UPI0034A59793
MSSIFDEMNGTNAFPTDNLTVTPHPKEQRRLRGLDNLKDGLEIWNQCKRDAITGLYRADPYVRAEIDAVYGNDSVQTNPNDLSFLSKPNAKPKPIDAMREIKREINAKYNIKE